MKRIIVGLIAIAIVSVFIFRNQLVHHGARNGQTLLMSAGLALGADVNRYADDGTTPLIAAAAAGQKKAVERLIAGKADVDHGSRDGGETPLMTAARLGHEEIIDALLQAGASLTQRDRENRTAYWHAFHNGQRSIARKVHWVPRSEVKLAALPLPPSASPSGVGSPQGDSESSAGSDVPWRDVHDVTLTVDEVNEVLDDSEESRKRPGTEDSKWKSRYGSGHLTGQYEREVTEEEARKLDEAKRKKLQDAREKAAAEPAP